MQLGKREQRGLKRAETVTSHIRLDESRADSLFRSSRSCYRESPLSGECLLNRGWLAEQKAVPGKQRYPSDSWNRCF